MSDYRILVNQGSDYILEATDGNNALEQFDVIRQLRGLDNLKRFQVIDVELVTEERPYRELSGVKIR
jgi:hypothetical protein